MNHKELMTHLLKDVPTHPHLDAFTSQFLESMKPHKLQTFSEGSFIQSMELSCCIFPGCTDYEKIYYIALANMVPFQFDDLVSDSIVEREILEQYDVSDNIFMKENRFALSLMSDMPASDFQRYRLQYKLWRKNSLFWLDVSPDEKNNIPFQDFLYWRIIDLGHPLIRTLVPYSLGLHDFHENELERSLKFRAYEMNILILNLYIQDLVSYKKEMSEVFPDNIILLAKGGYSEKNVKLLVSEILSLHEEINETRKTLIRELPEEEGFINAVYNYTYGAFKFYLITKRYANNEKCYK